MEIRPATPDDAEAITSLLVELGYPSSTADVDARLRSMLAASETVLVAARNGAPVGVITIHVTPVLHRPTPVGRITALVVTERARGQGVGQALVAAAESMVVGRGCGLIEVTSNQQRIEAHAFYERLGYERTSHRFKKALA
jgi:predicted N-acetyltransferase YhbS